MQPLTSESRTGERRERERDVPSGSRLTDSSIPGRAAATRRNSCERGCVMWAVKGGERDVSRGSRFAGQRASACDSTIHYPKHALKGEKPRHRRHPSCCDNTDLLYIEARLRTRLDEHDVQLLCLLLSFFRRHLPLVLQVSLVAHQHDDHVVPSLCPHVVDPLGCLVKGVCVCGDHVSERGT